MEQRIELIKERFLAIHDDMKKKLINGAMIRKDMWAAINRGDEMDDGHYRYKWLMECNGTVREILVDLASDFNHEHKDDDRASINDMIDVLKLTIKTLEKQIQLKTSKEEG